MLCRRAGLPDRTARPRHSASATCHSMRTARRRRRRRPPQHRAGIVPSRLAQLGGGASAAGACRNLRLKSWLSQAAGCCRRRRHRPMPRPLLPPPAAHAAQATNTKLGLPRYSSRAHARMDKHFWSVPTVNKPPNKPPKQSADPAARDAAAAGQRKPFGQANPASRPASPLSCTSCRCSLGSQKTAGAPPRQYAS